MSRRSCRPATTSPWGASAPPGPCRPAGCSSAGQGDAGGSALNAVILARVLAAGPIVEITGIAPFALAPGSGSPGRWSAGAPRTGTAPPWPERSKPSLIIRQQPPESALAMLRSRFGPAAHRYEVDGNTVLA